jgi:hypothetical protein
VRFCFPGSGAALETIGKRRHTTGMTPDKGNGEYRKASGVADVR